MFIIQKVSNVEEIIIKNKKELNEYKNKNVYKNKEEYQKLFEKIEELNSKIKEKYKNDEINIFSVNLVGTIYSENYKVKFPLKIEFEKTIDYEKRIFEMLSLVENLDDNIYESKDNLNSLNYKENFDSKLNYLKYMIPLFLREVEKVVKKGILWNYENLSDNSNFFKGKLMVSEHIRYNISKKNKFYINYDEFTPNNIENKILKLTLEKIYNLTDDVYFRGKIRKYLNEFKFINVNKMPKKQIKNLLSKFVVNKRNLEYKSIMLLAKYFLLNETKFSIFYDENYVDGLTSLFIRMNCLYENYIFKKLEKLIKEEENCTIKAQYAALKVFDNDAYKIRPDIVITLNKKEYIILDTKWKKLKENPKREDVYQMITYYSTFNNYGKNCKKIVLIYPKYDGIKEDVIKEYVIKDKLTLYIHFVDLESEESVEKSLKNLIETLQVKK